MATTSQPLVSIVTPVYNEEEHLSECVESILSQTYHNWEYIIVDNQSTDRTLEVARGYAAREPRIRIHENDRFLGMLANHNGAIRQISPASKYCKVVFGDDYIFPTCLERMVDVAEAHSSVGLVSAYELCGQAVRMTGLPKERTLVGGREACAWFLLDKLYLFGSQNSVLYRADLVRSRDPFYDETEVFADFESCFALLRSADLGFVHEVLTFSRPRRTSAGAVSSDMGAHYGSALRLLLAYGTECLSGEEFGECFSRKVSEYYRFLGRRLLIERNREFWSYHRQMFARAGIGFSRARVLEAAVGQFCESLLNPRSTMESLRRLFVLKEIRNRQARKLVLDAPAKPSLGEGPRP